MNIKKVAAFFALALIATGCMNSPLGQFDCRTQGLHCAEGFACISDEIGLFSCQPVDPESEPEPDPVRETEREPEPETETEGEPEPSTGQCGDGVVADGLEECDDANDNDDDGCTNTCEFGEVIERDDESEDEETDEADTVFNLVNDENTGEPTENEQGEDGESTDGLSTIGDDFVDEIEEAPAGEVDDLIDFLSVRTRPRASLFLVAPTAEATDLRSYAGYGPNAIDVNHVANGAMCIDIRPFGQSMEAFTRFSLSAGADGNESENTNAFAAALAAAGLSVADVRITTDRGAEFDPNNTNNWELMDNDTDGVFESEIRVYEGSTDVLIEVDGEVIATGTPARVELTINYNNLVNCTDDDIVGETELFRLNFAAGSALADALADDVDGRRVRLLSEGQGTSATLMPVNGIARVDLDTMTLETE